MSLRWRAALAIAALLVFATASLAVAEVVQKGTIIVDVSGSMKPKTLPRKGSSPISVSVGGHIKTTKGAPTPRLTTLKIELNRSGIIDTKGLPICPYDQIQPASTSRALSNCRSALVGRGSFTAEIALEGQEAYDAKGEMLAFNGVENGKPVLYGQIYSPRPFATSFVIVFKVKKLGKGTFGTALDAVLPKTLGTWGKLTGIDLTLSRTFKGAGQKRSYLSAGCPAPKGFTKVSFSLARTTFGFEGGKKLATTLSRTCNARG